MVRVVALLALFVGSQAAAGSLYQRCIEDQISLFKLRDVISSGSEQFGKGFRNPATGLDTPTARQANTDYKALKEAADALVASHDKYCREFTAK